MKYANIVTFFLTKIEKKKGKRKHRQIYLFLLHLPIIM